MSPEDEVAILENEVRHLRLREAALWRVYVETWERLEMARQVLEAYGRDLPSL